MTVLASCAALPRCRRALALALLVLHAAPSVLAAQSEPADSTMRPPTKPPRLTCFRGQPLPACRRFVLTELGFLRNVASTTRPAVGYDGMVLPGLRDRDHASEILAEFGLMQNISPSHAIGGVLVLGPDVGAKVRYRRWFDTAGVAIDLGAGVVREDRFRSRSAALVGDVALNFSDYASIVLRGQASHRGGRTSAGLHAGMRLGSKPAVITGTVLAVAIGVLVASFMSGGDW